LAKFVTLAGFDPTSGEVQPWRCFLRRSVAPALRARPRPSWWRRHRASYHADTVWLLGGPPTQSMSRRMPPPCAG